MAELILVDKDKYKVNGILDENDINKLNSFKNYTTIILDNTKGLSSDLVSKIKTNRVLFSIKGGLDYENKDKYKQDKYMDRTYLSFSGLSKVIKYFEYNESLINPQWNDFEKAMFLYNSLVVDMEYDENYETLQSPGTTERSLNGILYNKLVCAGFAQVYKEMLDRVGIKNYYQNQKDIHAFNIIEIDNKKYGVDVTWDNVDKKNLNGKCGFGRFAQDKDFYNRYGHQLYKETLNLDDDFENSDIKKEYDKDEELFDLSTLSHEEITKYYKNIEERINNRKTFKYHLQNQEEETKIKYLPIDQVKYHLEKEATDEYSLIIMLDFLNKRNALNINQELSESFMNRKGYLLDMALDKYRFGNLDLSSLGIENCTINKNGSIELNDGIQMYYDRVDHNDHKVPDDKTQEIYNTLNNHLKKTLDNLLIKDYNNIDILLDHYEYDRDNFDEDRLLINANIRSKLSIITSSKEYLKTLGVNEQELNNKIQKINSKEEEIYKPYKKETNQKENDLDFLHGVFSNMNLSYQAMQKDLNKQLSEEEFLELFSNPEYMTNLYEKYILLGNNKKFNMSDYNVNNQDLEQLLNEIINNYKEEKSTKKL